MRTSDIGEFGLIGRIRSAVATPASGVVAGIGDDCAVVRPRREKDLLFTCDSQISNVHFRMDWIGPEELGRRAAEVSMSDIAAMGGVPRWALCALSASSDIEVAWVDGFYEGLRCALGRAGVSLVGGNTARLDEGVMVEIFLCGEVGRGRALLRSGARPGDGLYVTGALGGSAAGLAFLCGELGDVDRAKAEGAIARHLGPAARLAEGGALGATGFVSSCIDVSDGLVQDAAHLAEESGVAVRIDAERIPVFPAARELAAEGGRDHLPWALFGGEEFELLFTAAPKDEAAIAEAFARSSLAAATRIGEIAAGAPGVVVTRDGEPLEMDRVGWDHFLRR